MLATKIGLRRKRILSFTNLTREAATVYPLTAIGVYHPGVVVRWVENFSPSTPKKEPIIAEVIAASIKIEKIQLILRPQQTDPRDRELATASHR